MTAQAPDELVIEYPGLDLTGLHLYSIARDPPGSASKSKFEYPCPPRVPENGAVCSAIWRGYIAKHRLTINGTLVVESFRFLKPLRRPETNQDPLTAEWGTQTTNDVIPGDFWLVMRSDFYGPSTYIPFHDGVLVTDTSKWVTLPGHGHPVARSLPTGVAGNGS